MANPFPYLSHFSSWIYLFIQAKTWQIFWLGVIKLNLKKKLVFWKSLTITTNWANVTLKRYYVKMNSQTVHKKNSEKQDKTIKTDTYPKPLTGFLFLHLNFIWYSRLVGLS